MVTSRQLLAGTRGVMSQHHDWPASGDCGAPAQPLASPRRGEPRRAGDPSTATMLFLC